MTQWVTKYTIFHERVRFRRNKISFENVNKYCLINESYNLNKRVNIKKKKKQDWYNRINVFVLKIITSKTGSNLPRYILIYIDNIVPTFGEHCFSSHIFSTKIATQRTESLNSHFPINGVVFILM